MRFSNVKRIATILLFFIGFSRYDMSSADPIDDKYLKIKIDSIFMSDSLERQESVKSHLKKASLFIENNQLDSAQATAELVTHYDINQLAGELLASGYYMLGKTYRLDQRPDMALKNYLIAIQKLRYSDDIELRSEIYQELALIYLEHGWISKSIQRYIDAYKIESRIGDELKQVELLKTIAALYIEINDIKSAVNYQEQLLKIYSYNNMSEALPLMKKISGNYFILNNFQAAVYLQSQILEYEKSAGNLTGQLATLLEFIKIYKEQPDYDLLYAYVGSFNGMYKNQKKKILTDSMKALKAECLTILGDLSVLQGNPEVQDDYKRALMYYDSSFQLLSSISNMQNAASAKLKIAKAHYELKDFKSTVDHSEYAIRIFMIENDYENLVAAYALTADAYKFLEKYKQAYQAQNALLQYTDSLDRIPNRRVDDLISYYKENAYRTALQNLEQSLLQKELDTLSDELLRLEIDNQKRDIELLVKEKSLNDLALKNEQLKNEQVTNENTLLQQKIEADLREKEILNLQAIRGRQESELKNQQIYQIKREQKLYALEQEKMVSDLQLQKAKAQKVIFLLSIIISLIILVSVIIGYINLKRSRSNIVVKNKLIEEHNEKLQELNLEKNRLIRIVAHDLKNPLINALTLSNILYEQNRDKSENGNNQISLIRRSLKRMQEMINKILDIKAIDAEKMNMYIEPINVKQIVGYVAELFSSRAEEKNILLLNNTSDIYINADRDYLIQILENLISNALKFSPDHTEVRFNAYDKKGTCIVSISDEGPGFSDMEKKQLFKENMTFAPRPTNGESSNGIGLSIVKKYVDAMNGKVWCESAISKGTIFYLEFEKSMVMA